MKRDRVLDDPGVIERLYWDEGKSTREIADLHGCSQNTVLRRMEEFGIERRQQGEALWKEPSRTIRGDGYALIQFRRYGKRYQYLEHRPELMRKYDWREIVENDLQCHHLDGDETNNDPSNLIALPKEEHGRLHAEERKRAEDGAFLPMAEVRSGKQQAETAALD